MKIVVCKVLLLFTSHSFGALEVEIDGIVLGLKQPPKHKDPTFWF